MRQDLPAGTVTFVFTDIEGSTRLLEELGTERYGELLSEHHRVCRVAWVEHGGVEVDTAGDAFFVAFPIASGALAAAREAQEGLAELGLRVRMGVHTGEVSVNETGYLGLEVHRAARIAAAAHGGQVVVSASTAALVGSNGLVDLGEHRFKDLSAPERVFQLGEGEFPSLTSLYRSNLPVPATPFLGREREVAEVVALLRDPGLRLVTLTGPGGTGKTRLAAQAAAEASDAFPDGVYWLPLAPLRDAALVLPALAQVLDVKEQPGAELIDALAERLAGKRMLVLLDNAEHLLPDLAPGMSRLHAVDGPTLLVTSRERLQLPGERSYNVPELEADEAVSLFVARARDAGVTLIADSAVTQLCDALERLPLALELAASRTPVFTPEQLVQRLSQRLDLLKAGRGADPRQETLRATIEWSYGLLDEHERRLLRALSVFAGGCTYDAATAVADADVDVLQSLIDKSLVRRRATEDEPRYWMLETIREYAAEALVAATEDVALGERFVGWLDALVGEVDEYWIERDQLEWFDALEAERANLMHGLSICRSRGWADREVRLIAAAFEFFDTRGPWEAVADILETAKPTDSFLKARARYARAVLLYRLWRIAEAEDEGRAALGEAEALDDEAGAAIAQAFLAGLAQFKPEADIEAQIPAMERNLERARASGDRYALAQSMNSFATLYLVDLERAHAWTSRAVHQALEIGDQRNAALFAYNLALTDLGLRRVREAVDGARRIIPVFQRIGDRTLEPSALWLLALAQVASGDYEGARATTAEMLAAKGERRDVVLETGGVYVLALAGAATAPSDAIAMWAAAERLRITQVSLGLPPELRPYVDDLLEPLRARPDFHLDWQRGESLDIDAALALGLNEE